MATTRHFILFFLLMTAVAGFAFQSDSHAASCDALVGKWAWFIGGEVTVNPDGTFVQQSGNAGTWECTDTAQGRFTFRWRDGGFVNSVVLSPGGRGLSSTDPSQKFVTAKRIGGGGTAQADTGASPPDVILTTQPDGALQLPKDLPELMHAATPRAREWRRDAIPVSLEFNNYGNAPNPTMRRPEVRIFFVPPATDTGRMVTVTADGMRPAEFNRPVSWGKLPLPPLFVDLPVAVSIARKNGMQGQVDRASLRIWSPSGAPPVLAWMVGDKTVNGGRVPVSCG